MMTIMAKLTIVLINLINLSTTTITTFFRIFFFEEITFMFYPFEYG